VEVVVGEWFRLPRLGSDVFMKLVRQAGLKYESGKGFLADAKTDLLAVSSILQSVLGEPIGIVLRCFVCGKSVECPTCVYNEVCDRRRVSPACICNSCRGKRDAFALYTLGFTELSD
jgi:hypothetical protein